MNFIKCYFSFHLNIGWIQFVVFRLFSEFDKKTIAGNQKYSISNF